jgi:F420-0:gamma-glutamyl ligase-like protein
LLRLRRVVGSYSVGRIVKLSEKFLRNLRKICPVESRKIAKKIVKISVS